MDCCDAASKLILNVTKCLSPESPFFDRRRRQTQNTSLTMKPFLFLISVIVVALLIFSTPFADASRRIPKPHCISQIINGERRPPNCSAEYDDLGVVDMESLPDDEFMSLVSEQVGRV